MLGFHPLSTFPISTIAASVGPGGGGITTGAGSEAGRLSGEGRRLTAHERRRRRVHHQQMAEWRREFEAMLSDAEALPAAKAAATAIARQVEAADDPGLVARRAFVEFFEGDATLGRAIILPSDRGDVARDVQQRRQIADIARRLREAIATERALIAADDDDVAAVLLWL